jgi:neurotransmitter:Na+ symporter, NSS family
MARDEFTKHGFILAAIGSAVGLGNIWRFPYLVGKSGGGAFLIPYFIGVILLGAPLLFFELGVGKHYKQSVISAFGKINSRWRYLGMIPVLTAFLVLSYYLVIMGWTAMYSLFSLAGQYPQFSEFTQTYASVALFAIMIFFVTLVVARGVKHGIEGVSKKLMPIFFVVLIALFINSLFLPGFVDGIKFYLTPNFSQLKNVDIWVLGFGQALFSLSVGQGIMLTYGSYMKKKQGIVNASAWIIFADAIIAVMAGFIIFPIVFTFGLNPAAGPELAFITLPQIFSSMSYGYLIGAMFFFLLFIGALTSAISILEVPVAALIDEFKFKRKNAAMLTSGALLIVGMPSALSYSGYDITLFGMKFLDAADHYVGSILVLVSSLILAVYIHKHDLLDLLVKEINYHSKHKLPVIIEDIFHFIVPGIILIMLIFNLL